MKMQGIGNQADDQRGGWIVYDWNHNGKIDAGDHAFTAFMIDQMESGNGDKPTGGCGCCGTTVAMFLAAVLLPVILTVVFVAH